MYRHLATRLAVGTISFALLTSCSDRPGVTDPNRRAAPAFDVSRFEQPLIIFHGQASPPLAVFLGVTAEEFPAFCADILEADVVANTMIVTHPTKQGGISEHVLIKATELSALVWRIDVAEADPCDSDVQPYVGTVKVVINDNEGQYFETAPGGNAFSIRFVGTVTDQETGQRYHLQGADQIVVLPDGTFKFLPVPFLRLTPIGG